MTLFGSTVTGLKGCSISSYLLAYLGTLLLNSHKSTLSSKSLRFNCGEDGFDELEDVVDIGDEGSENAGE